MNATDWAQIGSAVFTAAAALAAFLAVRNAQQQNRTARVSIEAQLKAAERAAVLGQKPVLVFVDDPKGGAWTLRNVGKGPALNVLVAQRDPRESVWMNPVIAPPLEAGETFELVWLDRVNDTGLGVTYTDSEDHKYTSTLGRERMRAYEGHQLPEWVDKEKKRYWYLNAGQAVGSRWAPRKSDFRTG